MEQNNQRLNKQKLIVATHTQRWSNIGLAIAFLCTALFTFFWINTDLPNIWRNLTDSVLVSAFYNALLFIPVGFLLILCVTANEKFNSIGNRISLLIGFAFLMSILLAFIVCTTFAPVINIYEFGIFLVYTLLVIFALFSLDIVLMPVMTFSQPLLFVPVAKTIISLPFVIIIMYVTQSWWVLLISLQVFILYFFYSAKTTQTWYKIDKLYIDGYRYKTGIAIYSINMFSYDSYKKLGLYLSLYNFLPNIFMVLSDNVEVLDNVTESIEKKIDENEKNILAFLVDDDLSNFLNEVRHVGFIKHKSEDVDETFNKKKVVNRLITGLVVYILICSFFFLIGNLFIPISFL